VPGIIAKKAQEYEVACYNTDTVFYTLAEREPITRVWGHSPSGVQGRSP